MANYGLRVGFPGDAIYKETQEIWVQFLGQEGSLGK